jgi:hypothetical protein
MFKNRSSCCVVCMSVGLILLLGSVRAPADEPKGKAPSELQKLQREVDQLRDRVSQLEQQSASAAGQEVEPPQKANTVRGKLFQLPEGFSKRLLTSERQLILNTDEAAPAGQSADTDQDGLTDAEEQQLGTNPQVRDTDGDALLDGWEVHSVNGIDLHVLGASPLRKDIFVEMDFMKRSSATRGLAPNNSVIKRIEAEFAAAPVANPDGTRGISIHLELGNEVPLDRDLNPYRAEFFTIKASHFDSARAPFFHYMIWADGYNGDSSSGVAMGIPHSDFIVTLGLWGNGTGGTDDQKVGTFIHELGHCLGLTHGGGADDHTNNKPNHISVMNYSFQTRGVPVFGDTHFRYQPFALPKLRETFLSEPAGLSGSGLLSGYRTFIGTRQVDAEGPIDWNGNGTIESFPIAQDLNDDGILEDLLATPDQWNSLTYNGGTIGSGTALDGLLEFAERVSQPFPYIELTEELDQSFAIPQ